MLYSLEPSYYQLMSCGMESHPEMFIYILFVFPTTGIYGRERVKLGELNYKSPKYERS